MGGEVFLPLKRYLEKDAKAHQGASLARSYVFADDVSGKVGGYITIICGEIEVEIAHGNGVNYPYKRYPAVKIARLAVDSRLRGNDLGTRLVDLSVAITRDIICPNVGCRFLVVDAKQDSIAFYQKYGFTLIDTDENRARQHPVMFIDLLRT